LSIIRRLASAPDVRGQWDLAVPFQERNGWNLGGSLAQWTHEPASSIATRFQPQPEPLANENVLANFGTSTRCRKNFPHATQSLAEKEPFPSAAGFDAPSDEPSRHNLRVVADQHIAGV
jgi:hypothetical protein